MSEARQHADLVKAALSRNGHEAVTPFDVCHGKNPSYEDYICDDLQAMLDCDAVCFCNGWEGSCECAIEHDVVFNFKAFDRKDFKVIYE